MKFAGLASSRRDGPSGCTSYFGGSAVRWSDLIHSPLNAAPRPDVRSLGVEFLFFRFPPAQQTGYDFPAGVIPLLKLFCGVFLVARIKQLQQRGTVQRSAPYVESEICQSIKHRLGQRHTDTLIDTVN